MSHFQVGPIPGHLDHDTIYNSLRSIFQARGPVCFMFLHKVGSCSILFEIRINYNMFMFIFLSIKSSIKYVFFQGAVKDNNTGKPVKFGYVVFAERGVAQKVLKSGSIAFNGGIQIKVSPMLWFFHLTLCNFQVESNFFTGMREAPLGILWPHSAITNWRPQYQNYFNQQFPAFNSKSYFVSSFGFAIWLKIVPLTDLLLELRDDIWLYCSFGVLACLVKINEKTS